MDNFQRAESQLNEVFNIPGRVVDENEPGLIDLWFAPKSTV